MKMMILSLAVFLILHPIIFVESHESCLSEDSLVQVSTPSDQTPYVSLPNTPVLECAAWCSESTGCEFFKVDTASLTCHLYGNGSTDTGIDTQNVSSWIEETTGPESTSVTPNEAAEGRSTQCEAGRENVALKKPTKHSSVYSDNRYPSHLAVDGGKDMNIANGSCTHTDHNPEGRYGWWSVDLMAVYDIQYITIWNRGDCCSERLSDFTVYVGNQSTSGTDVGYKQCIHHPGWFKGSKNLSCDQWSGGQFVKIEITNGEYLSLCEVEVFPRICESG